MMLRGPDLSIFWCAKSGTQSPAAGFLNTLYLVSKAVSGWGCSPWCSRQSERPHLRQFALRSPPDYHRRATDFGGEIRGFNHPLDSHVFGL